MPWNILVRTLRADASKQTSTDYHGMGFELALTGSDRDRSAGYTAFWTMKLYQELQAKSTNKYYLTGVIILPTPKMHYYKGNATKLHKITILSLHEV